MHDPHSERMSGSETRAASGLALVFAFRMLGMFMVLPVLATYGMDLAGATPALIGLAIGAYGLTQAIFQIPFGIISDRIGRRPVIYFGLIVFALGSVLAANSDSIWGVIAGRVLQGAGAISAAVMALLSDLTREQHRTKAMAMIGMTIGLSFAVAMVVGPLLTRAFGLSGLFLATGAMALLGIVIVMFMVPRSTGTLQHRESGVAKKALMQTLRHPDLLRLDLGIFVLHAMLMSSFIALPLALVEKAGLPKEQHWWVYLTALLISFFAKTNVGAGLLAIRTARCVSHTVPPESRASPLPQSDTAQPCRVNSTWAHPCRRNGLPGAHERTPRSSSPACPGVWFAYARRSCRSRACRPSGGRPDRGIYRGDSGH